MTDTNDACKGKVCGQIQYNRADGSVVHSDICFRHTEWQDATKDESIRKLLHDVLDEWLDKSNGTGAFWLGADIYSIMKEFD